MKQSSAYSYIETDNENAPFTAALVLSNIAFTLTLHCQTVNFAILGSSMTLKIIFYVFLLISYLVLLLLFLFPLYFCPFSAIQLCLLEIQIDGSSLAAECCSCPAVAEERKLYRKANFSLFKALGEKINNNNKKECLWY